MISVLLWIVAVTYAASVLINVSIGKSTPGVRAFQLIYGVFAVVVIALAALALA